VGWPRSNGRDLILILARHYIAAAAADGEGWMNLEAQADAAKEDAAMSPVVEAAPAKPPTVADLLRVLPVMEWCDADGWCRQAMGDGSSRCWWPDAARWSPWDGVVDEDNGPLPARLVPASEADADPATRGPIGGG
jgi:hypothetical protein